MAKSTFLINVSDAQLKSLSQRGFVAASGTLPETSGVQLSYVMVNNDITFTIEKKPFLIPVSAIQSHVQQLISG